MGQERKRPDPSTGDWRRRYWRANICLIAALLMVWAVVSYLLGILLVESLNRFRLGGLPLGFWFAHQGAIYVFVVLIFVYAWGMDRLDRRYGVGERRSRQRQTDREA